MIPAKLQSRKLFIALAGIVLPIVGSYLSEEVNLEKAVSMSIAAVIAYLVSQGYVDGKRVEGMIEPIPYTLREQDDDYTS